MLTTTDHGPLGIMIEPREHEKKMVSYVGRLQRLSIRYGQNVGWGNGSEAELIKMILHAPPKYLFQA